MLMLLLLKNCDYEKDGNKKNSINVYSFRCGKVVFVLPNKVVAVYVKLIPIHI